MKKYIIFSVFVVFGMVGVTNPAPAAVQCMFNLDGVPQSLAEGATIVVDCKHAKNPMNLLLPYEKALLIDVMAKKCELKCSFGAMELSGVTECEKGYKVATPFVYGKPMCVLDAVVEPSVSPKAGSSSQSKSGSSSKSSSSSQPKATVEKTVSGVVYGKNSDGTEEVLLGASVSINGVKSGSYGKNITVSTDPNGKFTLSGFDKNATDLTVSFIGFKDYTYKMSPSKLTESGIRIVLEEDSELLGEVVVSACGLNVLKTLYAKTAVVFGGKCVPTACADGYVLVDANNNASVQPATCVGNRPENCIGGAKCVVSGSQNATPGTKLEPGVVNGVSIPGALPTKPGDLKIERPNLKPTEQPTNLAGCFEVVDAWNYWVYFEHAKHTLSDTCRAHVVKELNKLLGGQDLSKIGCINMVGYADATNDSGSYDNGKLSLDRANYVQKLVPANMQSAVKPRGGGDVTALANDGRGTANAKERSVHVFVGQCLITPPTPQGNSQTQVSVNVNINQAVVTEEQLRAESRAKILAAGKVLDSISGSFKTSVWKNKDGGFNTARLASDGIAGVVLGTAGGLITSNIIKKNQIKSGFEDIQCTISGQVIASFGDDFQVGIGLR